MSSARPILCALYFAPVVLFMSRKPQSVSPLAFTVQGPYFSRILSAIRSNLSSNSDQSVLSGSVLSSAGLTNSFNWKYLHLYCAMLAPLDYAQSADDQKRQNANCCKES